MQAHCLQCRSTLGSVRALCRDEVMSVVVCIIIHLMVILVLLLIDILQSSDWVVMIPNWNGASIVIVVDLLSVCFTRLEKPTRGV